MLQLRLAKYLRVSNASTIVHTLILIHYPNHSIAYRPLTSEMARSCDVVTCV